MQYNKYFTIEDEIQILSLSNTYKYQYHIIVTFPNIASVDKYIDRLYKHLEYVKCSLFSWHCNTSRKYKKASNSHTRKKHLHMILFSDNKFSFNKYDTAVIEIYDLKGLIDYIIHDNHHIINKNYYKQNSISFREVLKNLRVSNI